MVHGKEVNLIAHNKHLKRSLKKISGHLWISKVRNVIYKEIIINSLILNFRWSTNSVLILKKSLININCLQDVFDMQQISYMAKYGIQTQNRLLLAQLELVYLENDFFRIQSFNFLTRMRSRCDIFVYFFFAHIPFCTSILACVFTSVKLCFLISFALPKFHSIL